MKLFQIVVPLISFSTVEGFTPSTSVNSLIASSLYSTAAETDDILKPKYDIEPIPLRIGHGFDIHRMAPLEEAGQPVVIGGVTITHKDQKVIEYVTNQCSFHPTP